jgi:elongation factor G
MAVKEAAPKLQAALLEPIVKAQIRIPEELLGDIIGDLNAKRGRVLGMDSDGDFRVITAEAPMAEMQRYAIDLRSLTAGRGSFDVEMSHYEEAPPHETQKVIAASQSKV